MGFHDIFIKWTTFFYQGVESTIIVNGVASLAFTLGRAVRQGCLLAPYLYLLVADVLGYMMRDPTYRVQGLTLSNRDKSLEMHLRTTFFFLYSAHEKT